MRVLGRLRLPKHRWVLPCAEHLGGNCHEYRDLWAGWFVICWFCFKDIEERRCRRLTACASPITLSQVGTGNGNAHEDALGAGLLTNKSFSCQFETHGYYGGRCSCSDGSVAVLV